MFRFLDKRFYHKGRWEFDLQTFACEHIGLSKNYSNSELKRKLMPAVKELEARGYLSPLPDAERFVEGPAGELEGRVREGREEARRAAAGRATTRSRRNLVDSRHHAAECQEARLAPRANSHRGEDAAFRWMKSRGGEGANPEPCRVVVFGDRQRLRGRAEGCRAAAGVGTSPAAPEATGSARSAPRRGRVRRGYRRIGDRERRSEDVGSSLCPTEQVGVRGRSGAGRAALPPAPVS